MELNSIGPVLGEKHAKRRVGRGIGSGLGKTCGRGHKGQSSRAGGYHKVGFEGGQMPLQRRLPKRGFKSMNHKFTVDITLASLNLLAADEIDLNVLKAASVVPSSTKEVKIICSGEVTKAFKIHGIGASAAAKAAIVAAGGAVADLIVKPKVRKLVAKPKA